LLLEELYLALFWFHPLAWWLRSRMRLAREQLVDARSVQLTGAPKSYIEALIHSARHHHEPKARLAPGFGNRQQLGHRMRALLTEVPMSSTRLVLSCSAIVLALLVTLWAVLGLVPLTGRAELALVHTLAPRPPQDDASDGAVEVVVGHMSLLPGAEQRVIVELTYDPNGEVVDSRVLSGPEGLRQSALRIALGRRFTTSLLRLQIHVVFRGPVEGENRPIPGTPPPTGGEPLRVGGSVMAGLLRYQVEPEWPPLAASAEITDDVILEATIGTGGAIEALRVVSGHNLLRDAAVDAVRYWRYAPYLLNGEAMRVTTTVVVPFRTAP
jgi:TonB family protein